MIGALCMPSVAQRLSDAVEYAEAHKPEPLPLVDPRVKDVITRQREIAASMGVRLPGAAA